MATETKLEQHLRLRNHTPAITRPAPVVNDLLDGMDEISAFSERAIALLSHLIREMNDEVNATEGVPKRFADAIYRIWLLLLITEEKYEELDELIKAAVEKAYGDRRAAA